MDYTKIPYFDDIFNDFIYNFDKIKQFFNGDYKNISDFHEVIYQKSNSYLQNKQFDRNVICDILKEQNKFFNSSQRTFDNIELLRKDNTFTVTTGQQAGLATGNIYTIYKAINTIQLADYLSVKFPQYNFVPLFWLEVDDHDFGEVNNINILNKENELVNIKYHHYEPDVEKFLTPVFQIDLNSKIQIFIDELKSNIVKTDFSDEITDYVERSYKPGINYVTAFARFFNYLLNDKGLIFCNAAEKEFKQLLIPIFLKELNTFPQSCEIVIDTSEKLERHYEPQVKPRAINMFFNNNSSRYLIEPSSEIQFGLKNSRKKFEKSELFEILESNPELFSANVILRPVCQDYLFPTVCYVGGPSEVAYFAQLKKVYEYFFVTMPIIFPRTSASLIENKVTSFFTKYNLNFEDFIDFQNLKLKLLEQLDTVNVENLFTKYKDEIRGLEYSMEKELIKVDKNLIAAFKGRNDKYIETIDTIKAKFIESQIKQNDTAMSKLKSVSDMIFPVGNLQERYFNIINYLNKYSLKLIDFLFEQLKIGKFEHQLIDLNFKSIESKE